MKLTALFLLGALSIYNVNGQVKTKYYPQKNALELFKPNRKHVKPKIEYQLPTFDINQLLKEDIANKELDIPFRFGKGFDVNLKLENGEWENLENGRLWSISFKSSGAFSINFIFENLFLSENAELYISNSDETILYGSVTSKHNTKNGYFLTDLIRGDDVTIFLFEPKTEIGLSTLTIKRVVHAYKNIFYNMANGDTGSSENCNNDVVCFPSWDDESDAVALILLSDGTEWCSGSLLMTTEQNLKPYFLTAFHCIDTSYPYGSLSSTEITNAENWLFKFQYKMTTCDGSSATEGISYNGAEFRAAWHNTDFALMEMDNFPIEDSHSTWLGWDRSGNTPPSGTGIHHPSGDAMKISFENNQFQTSSWNGTNNHWLVSFDDGIVEHGSSGSPILNENKRVIGQLHGNTNYDLSLSYCSQPRAEYGRLGISWIGGGTNSTRLSNWLDPNNTGALTTNTTRSPKISGPSTVCSLNTTYTIENLPSGTSIEWSNSSNILRMSDVDVEEYVVKSNGVGSGWIKVNINGTIINKNVDVGVNGSFTGPYSINYLDYGTWFANANCGTEPYYYQWYLDKIGDNDAAAQIGTGQQLSLKSVAAGTSQQQLITTETIESPTIMGPSNYTTFNLSLKISDDNGYYRWVGERTITAYGDVDLIQSYDPGNPTPFNMTATTEQIDYVTIYPNPADDELIISSLSDLTIDLILYDEQSNIIFKGKLNNKDIVWNTSKLDEGIYYIHIYKGDELTKRQILIEHK